MGRDQFFAETFHTPRGDGGQLNITDFTEASKNPPVKRCAGAHAVLGEYGTTYPTAPHRSRWPWRFWVT
jgi:hypothetical protein